VWEEMFLPLELRDHLRLITITDPQGNEVPLVLNEGTLYESTRGPAAAMVPDRIASFLASGVLIGGVFAGLAWLSVRWPAGWLRRSARTGFAVATVLWTLFIGGQGVVLVYGWIFTQHWAGYWNENLMQLNPLAITMVVLAPMLALGRARARQWAWWVALALVGFSLLGLVLQALPWFYQVNGEIIALLLFAHVGLAAAVWFFRGAPLAEHQTQAAPQAARPGSRKDPGKGREKRKRPRVEA
jgi:hypothetical protein